MPSKQGFLEYNLQRNVNRFYINTKKTFNITYAPELISDEDLEVVINHFAVLDEGSPLIIRSNYWDYITHKILFSNRNNFNADERKNALEFFINRHSFLFYEPPEFFQFLYPNKIVTQAFGADITKKRNFNKKIKKIKEWEDIQKVINLLPEFYRPFFKEQFIKYLLHNKKKTEIIEIAYDLFSDQEINKRPNIHRVWKDKQIDNSYPTHIFELFLEANKANRDNNTALIPPVPLLYNSSSISDFDFVNNLNLTASLVRKNLGIKYPHVYYHLYLDWKSICNPNSGLNAKSLLNIIEKKLEHEDFSGICLTLKGYKNAFENGKFAEVESFISDLSSLAEYHYLPLILPRSNLYGLKLLDSSINCFGTLLNGKTKISKTGGFGIVGNKNDRLDFGKTYIIDACRELNYKETEKFYKKNGGFPKIDHLPSIIDSEDSWNKKAKFRLDISKPRRLSHMEEARRIRKATEKNVIKPAARYLERSDNPQFRGQK